jgi:hypothetical protein
MGVQLYRTKKGKARASADVGLMFIAYNFRRIGNILTWNVLKEYLRLLVSLFLARLTESILRHLGTPGALRPEFARCGAIFGKILTPAKAA